jgi:hypothetical protein
VLFSSFFGFLAFLYQHRMTTNAGINVKYSNDIDNVSTTYIRSSIRDGDSVGLRVDGDDVGSDHWGDCVGLRVVGDNVGSVHVGECDGVE